LMTMRVTDLRCRLPAMASTFNGNSDSDMG
jgi:hypothetical protein